MSIPSLILCPQVNFKRLQDSKWPANENYKIVTKIICNKKSCWALQQKLWACKWMYRGSKPDWSRWPKVKMGYARSVLSPLAGFNRMVDTGPLAWDPLGTKEWARSKREASSPGCRLGGWKWMGATPQKHAESWSNSREYTRQLICLNS